MRTAFFLSIVTASLFLQPSLQAEETSQVTFSKEIAPIIFNNCTSCHRPGEAAPFPLQTYEDVQKRAELIQYVVSAKLMPPWKAESPDVSFKGDRRLTEGDRKTLLKWIQDGMPEGNPSDLPPLPEFSVGWQFDVPDLVITMPEAYTVPGEGPDIYRNFVVPTGLTEDRWVQAVEFRPSAPAVVHHSLFFVDANHQARQLDDAEKGPGFRGGMARILGNRSSGKKGPAEKNAIKPGFGGGVGLLANSGFGSLGGWALGAQPYSLPQGLAFHLPAGSDVIISTHFHPSGKKEQEASTIGLFFSKTPPQKRFTIIQLPPAFGAFEGISIPAGEKEYVIEDEFVLPVDVQAFGIGAHAHYLGKTMTMTATLPTGKTITLLSIPDWDFAWQEQYEFEEFISLPKGTRLHSRITYDNSADNPNNPHLPPVRVRFGEESEDEMGGIGLRVIATKEADFTSLQQGYQEHLREEFRNADLMNLLWRRMWSR